MRRVDGSPAPGKGRDAEARPAGERGYPGHRAMAERSRRDLALDLLRGYFLFIILVDHLRYAVNPLYYLSGKQSLWVTAAEGFVLVSGFLVGKLRGDQARAQGLGAASRHLVRRAAVLWLWCAILTIGFRVISTSTGYWPDVPNADEPGSLLDWSLGAIVLRRAYGDHNLLAAYALFLLVAPLGLYAMLRGRTLVFLAASGLLWGAGFQYWLRWSNTVQADACWQLLFALGMAAGFHHERLAARWAALTVRARRAILGAGAALSAAILAGSALRALVPPDARPRLELLLWDRDRLGPARIACAVVVVATMYAYARIFEAGLARTVGRLFVPLGQSSLYVYIVQSMLTFLLVDRAMADPWLALATNLAVVGLVWIFVQYRVLFGIIPR
jgi:hypothetical protein